MSNLSERETADLAKFFRLTIGSEMSQIEIDEAIEYVSSISTDPDYSYVFKYFSNPAEITAMLRTSAVANWLDDEGNLISQMNFTSKSATSLTSHFRLFPLGGIIL